MPMNNPNTPNSNHATSPELLPCPFCGLALVKRNPPFQSWWHPEDADHCILYGEKVADEPEEIAAWNTRQPQSPSYAGVTDAMLEALEYIVRQDGKGSDGFIDWQCCVNHIQDVARDAMRAADTSDGEVEQLYCKACGKRSPSLYFDAPGDGRCYECYRTRVADQSLSTSEAERLLKYALEAIETDRSEPLFIARDAIRNYFEDREAMKSKEQSND